MQPIPAAAQIDHDQQRRRLGGEGQAPQPGGGGHPVTKPGEIPAMQREGHAQRA